MECENTMQYDQGHMGSFHYGRIHLFIWIIFTQEFSIYLTPLEYDKQIHGTPNPWVKVTTTHLQGNPINETVSGADSQKLYICVMYLLI